MPEHQLTAFNQFRRGATGIYKNVLMALLFSASFACTHTKKLKEDKTDVGPNERSAVARSELEKSRNTEFLIRILPETAANTGPFINSEVGQRLKRMTGREPSPQDFQAIVALRALLVAQREIQEQRPAQARELAKFVLSTEHLSTQLYAIALKYLAFADVLQLSETKVKSEVENIARDPRREFNALQQMQCSSACQLHGWQVLAQEDAGLLTSTGYRTRLLSEISFKSENLQQPQWLKKIFLNSLRTEKKDKLDEIGPARTDTRIERIFKLRAMIDNRQWSQASAFAKKILNEKSSVIGAAAAKNSCHSDVIFAQYTVAQAMRIAQDRQSFAQLQNDFVRELDRSRCTAESFAFDKEQFDSFKLDARLWLARLQWEQNKNAEAFHSARMVLNEASTLQSWEHFIDAAKILIGRVGFEILNPSENLTFLAALERTSPHIESEEFQVWISSRRGLFQFLDGNFEEARKSFERVILLTTDTSTRSMAFYWMGRSQYASNNSSEGENAFLSAGMTDPLSIYDIFSGQLLARESGRASTQAKNAFYSDWNKEFESWLEVSEKQPLRIISSVPPRAQVSISQTNSQPLSAGNSQIQFDISLETSILFVALIRASMPEFTPDDFSNYTRESDELIPSFLRAEAQLLRQSFQRLNTLHSDVLPRAHQVAWLTHVMGDHSNSILFVGRLRETLGWDTDYLPFLYFIFYPRPYSQEFQAAAQRCSIDVDLLYAVARQESLFQASAKSPVGAVGLMQLLPSTASRVLKKIPDVVSENKMDLTQPSVNLTAGACYLKQLLERYDNNLTFAVAAYNAGEAAVDHWVNRRQKISDMPFFIEFIPYAETKTYVQRVLRNYYNLKWIYRSEVQN